MMRLWASCDSITFDELVPKQAPATVEVAFGLSPEYVSDQTHAHGWPLEFTSLGESGLCQIPALQRTATAVAGRLARDGGKVPGFLVRSSVEMRLLTRTDSSWKAQLERKLGEENSVPCWAFGWLSMTGHELASAERTFYPVRIHRFLSLCLHSEDSRFGEWFEVKRYGDLGSDPDVIAGAVLVAEMDLDL